MRWCGTLLLFITLSGLAAQSVESPVIDSLYTELAMLEEKPFESENLNKKARLSLALGLAYHNKGAYEEAGKHLKKAHTLATQTGDSLLLASILNHLGENHLKQGATDSAIFYFNHGLLVAYRTQSLENLKAASVQLYAIHKQQNNYAEALRYYELYQSAKDTLIKREHIRMITRLEKDYNYHIERYEDTAKIQQQRFFSIIAFSGFTIAILVILFLIVYFRLKQAKEREKRKIQEQLMVQERMASLGMLTAGIAHEIKNPLNFINNFAGVNKRLIGEIMEELNQDPAIWSPQILSDIKKRLINLKQNSADIEYSGKEINRIVHTMMDHSRGSSDAKRMVDLNELAEENINLVYQSYRATHPDLQVQISNQFDPELPRIEMYPHNIARVLINILGNAFYALNLKHLEFLDFKPGIVVATNTTVQGDVEITIRDNGPGIPLDLRQKIFTPFFTTKPVGSGNTGLGLSISYNIVVHEHHGLLEVESEVGAFTHFRIVLPGASNS